MSLVRTSAKEPLSFSPRSSMLSLPCSTPARTCRSACVAIVEPGLAAFVGRVDAAIPDDHFACAVLSGRDHALERAVVVGMILHVHGEALFAGIERRSLGNRPGLEHTVAFEPEVVVQPAGRMLLDDEQQRPATPFGKRGSRFGRCR